MKYLMMLAAVVMLTGCASEVDKCVNAEMKAWSAERNDAIKYNEQNKSEIEEAERKNKKISEDFEKIRSGNNEPIESGRIKSNEDGFIPLSEFEHRKVNKKEIDTTPKEVVEAIKRRMCIQLLK